MKAGTLKYPSGFQSVKERPEEISIKTVRNCAGREHASDSSERRGLGRALWILCFGKSTGRSARPYGIPCPIGPWARRSSLRFASATAMAKRPRSRSDGPRTIFGSTDLSVRRRMMRSGWPSAARRTCLNYVRNQPGMNSDGCRRRLARATPPTRVGVARGRNARIAASAEGMCASLVGHRRERASRRSCPRPSPR